MAEATLADILAPHLGKEPESRKKKVKEMPQLIIIARLRFQPGQKIDAIKVFRQAVGCDLKDAKDVIEYGERLSGALLRLNSNQFGKLTALIQTHAKKNVLGLRIEAEAIEPENLPDMDFT